MATLEGIAAQVRSTEEPTLLVLQDGSRFVVQTEADYEELLKDAEETRFVKAVMEGVADVQAGRVMPMEEAFERVRQRLGL